MRVLEALLVKSCGPLSFILLVQWSHDSIQDEQKMIFDVTATLIVTYACWWLLFGHKHGIRKRDRSLFANIILDEWNIFLFILQFSVVFNMFGNEQQKEFITEHVVPFMDFCSLFKCIKHELWCILNFACRYTRIMKITSIKCIILFFYLFVHAACLVMILDFIYCTCVATTHLYLTDLFFNTYNADLLKDYPDGYGVSFQLDKDQNYPAFVKETLRQNENGTLTRMNLTKEIYKDSKDTYLPYNDYSVLRYIGEDVEFSCSFLYTNSSRFKIIWLKNGEQLTNSNRYFFDTIIERDKSPENRGRYSIEPKLRILVINRFDFGKYECVLTTSRRETVQLLNTIVMTTEKFVISVHNLAELQPERRVLYREVGSLVKSLSFFYYHSFQSEDITLEYTINDQPMARECKGYLLQTCSLGSKLQQVFGSKDINKLSDGNLPIIMTYYSEPLNIYYAIIEFCLCHNGYGIHRLSFRRNVYMKSRKRSKILEFQHPFAVIILPQTKLSLFRYFDDNNLYKEIENLINNGTDLDVIQRRMNNLLHFISANEEKVFSIANVVQCCITIIFLSIVNIILRISIKLYIKWFIRLPVRRYIFPSVTYHRQHIHVEIKTYDIVISHTDADYTFVAEVLVPFLERECHLRVCLPDRDFTPGKSIFKLYKDAFDTSRKIIVVLSSQYLNDAQCGIIQLENMILPLLFEERKGKQDVLFIKYDKASRIPEPLRWNFDVDVLSWTTEVQTILKLKRIRSWYFTEKL